MRVVGVIAHGAGAIGMVGGQAIDLQHMGAASEPTTMSVLDLQDMHARKTGALLLVVDVLQLRGINDRFGYGVGDDSSGLPLHRAANVPGARRTGSSWGTTARVCAAVATRIARARRGRRRG